MLVLFLVGTQPVYMISSLETLHTCLWISTHGQDRIQTRTIAFYRACFVAILLFLAYLPSLASLSCNSWLLPYLTVVRTPPICGMELLNPGEMHHLSPISVLATIEQNFGSSAAGTMQSKYTREEQGRKTMCYGVGTWRKYLFWKVSWAELLGMTFTEKFSKHAMKKLCCVV